MSTLVAVSTFLLIFIGGLVSSTGSGLSVPDWPNTYGHFMFSFPLAKMVGGILYEHGHRMVASVVGLFMTIFAVWIWFKEKRKWVKWLGLAALLAVILQGVLGGLTVLYLLPTSVSVLHGCLAQGFFMLTVALFLFTSKDWITNTNSLKDEHTLKTFYLAMVTTIVIYIQLILGAIMRHSGAGLAIPDFPLAFGKIIPSFSTQAITIHFLHRIGAVVVTLFILWTALTIMRRYRSEQKIMRPAYTLVAALVFQVYLAAFTIWSRKAVVPTTAHVANGAFILGTSLFLTLRVFQLTHLNKRQKISYEKTTY